MFCPCRHRTGIGVAQARGLVTSSLQHKPPGLRSCLFLLLCSYCGFCQKRSSLAAAAVEAVRWALLPGPASLARAPDRVLARTVGVVVVSSLQPPRGQSRGSNREAPGVLGCMLELRAARPRSRWTGPLAAEDVYTRQQ